MPENRKGTPKQQVFQMLVPDRLFTKSENFWLSVSRYDHHPSFTNSVSPQVGEQRSWPDVSLNAAIEPFRCTSDPGSMDTIWYQYEAAVHRLHVLNGLYVWCFTEISLPIH